MQRETLAPSSSSYSTSSSSAIRAPPEDAWVDAHQTAPPMAISYSLSPVSIIPISISRVNQADAQQLDIEMSAMLKEQLVKFLIWRFSIWVDKPTPGNSLMNLRYRDERAIEPRVKERAWRDLDSLLLRNFGTGQYIWARLQSFSAFRRWGDSEQTSLPRRAWILIQRIEGIFKAASFGNLLIFLYTRRSTKSKTCLWSPNMNRAVSFEYMNRQLVWNEFSEMLLLLLPLINSSSIKKFLHPFSKDKSSSSEGDDTTCPICLASPTIPFLAHSCQHRAIVITAFEHGVLQLHHSGAPDAMSQLLPCSGMVA
ncbi:unnamed protein product [Camellia sinensis]